MSDPGNPPDGACELTSLMDGVEKAEEKIAAETMSAYAQLVLVETIRSRNKKLSRMKQLLKEDRMILEAQEEIGE